jgi:hypothetical protein
MHLLLNATRWLLFFTAVVTNLLVHDCLVFTLP